MHECMRGVKMKAKVALPLLGAGAFLAMRGIALASEGGGHGLNWWDFTLRLVNFSILVAFLVYLAKKPVTNFFSSRREEIQRLLTELEAKHREADAKSAEYKAKLATLEDETKKIVSEYVAEGEAERTKIIEAAQKQAEYIRAQAQLAIQQEIKAARDSLHREISDMSVNAAEDLLRKNMKAEDQDRLVRDFMTRVVEAK